MTVRGRDLYNIQLPSAGVRYALRLEAEFARQWHHISPAEWDAMDGNHQAYYVAVYRAKHQLEAVVAHNQAKDAEKKNRSKYGKR